MIKRLRWRIALMNTGLIGMVLLAIFAAVCVNDYAKARDDLEHSMNQVFGKGGKDPGMPFEPDGKEKEDFKNKPDIRDNAPMQISSYVIVTLDEEGGIAGIEENNATIDENELEICVRLARESAERSGQLRDYGLMYVKKDEPSQSRIVFASSSTLGENLRRTVLISLALFAGGMVIVLFISLGLSWLAVKPVKKAWEQQKQFVADASHELKTPLTVILANNNIMLSHPQSTVEQERKWLESTEDEAQHMKQLIEQMLFLAKSDAGGLRAEVSPVSFSEIVEGSSLNFEPVAFERGVLIGTEIDPDVILEGDPTQLNQLAHILIDNAVKYADENTTVTIILRKKNEHVEFSVNNHGAVIAKEDMEHIFDRFYRAEKSRTTKGYGLGLSIAQRIVESMNGRLTVQSDPADGTTFTVLFR